MRKRINRAAVCSSGNYETSKKLHLDYLREQHNHFKEITVNGELSLDVPILKEGKVTQRFKTIRVFGKNIKVTIDEFNTHCVNFK